MQEGQLFVFLAHRGRTLMKTLVAMATVRSQRPIDLQWENACHHNNSFSFVQKFLKLADKLDLDEISDEFK